MSGKFTVDLEQLDDVVSRLGSLAGFIGDKLTALDNKVAALHGGNSWVGVAADAHVAAHKQWAEGAREFHTGVLDLQAAAKQAHGYYTDTATTNSAALRGGQ